MTIRIISRCDDVPTDLDGRWLVAYDPKRGGVDDDGRRWCHLVTTEFRAQARQFRSLPEAMAYFHQDTGGLRHDGEPDRPLTAFNVEII
jgi:hypothetical protein